MILFLTVFFFFSGFTFRSMIHFFELIFVYGARCDQLLLLFYLHRGIHVFWASQETQVAKNPPADAGDAGLIPGSEIPAGGGHGNTLQYSCLENSMHRGAWQSMGLQRVRHNWACACACAHIYTRVRACARTHTHTHTHTHSSLPASFVVPHRMWDPSSLTRAQICVSCIGRKSLKHSTTREVHDPWMYLANCTNLLTFLTTCEILSFQNKILNEICLITNWLWYFPEGLWKITKSLFLHLVKRCYNN